LGGYRKQEVLKEQQSRRGYGVGGAHSVQEHELAEQLYTLGPDPRTPPRVIAVKPPTLNTLSTSCETVCSILAEIMQSHPTTQCNRTDLYGSWKPGKQAAHSCEAAPASKDGLTLCVGDRPC
jgi:hypothetical protein